MTQSLCHSSFFPCPNILIAKCVLEQALPKQPLCSWVSMFPCLCLGVGACLLSRTERCWPSCRFRDLFHPEAGAEGTQACPPGLVLSLQSLSHKRGCGCTQGSWLGLKQPSRKVRYRAVFPALVWDCSSSYARARTRGESPGTCQGLGTASSPLPV